MFWDRDRLHLQKILIYRAYFGLRLDILSSSNFWKIYSKIVVLYFIRLLEYNKTNIVVLKDLADNPATASFELIGVKLKKRDDNT